jgi:hypothetical protein
LPRRSPAFPLFSAQSEFNLRVSSFGHLKKPDQAKFSTNTGDPTSEFVSLVYGQRHAEASAADWPDRTAAEDGLPLGIIAADKQDSIFHSGIPCTQRLSNAKSLSHGCALPADFYFS